MKMIYIITGVLIVALGLIYFLTKRNNNENENQDQQQQLTKVDSVSNPYNDLRNLALSTTAEQIGFQLSRDKMEIFGIVMDWDLENGTATLIAFQTGDASLYLSSGGGIIGGGGHDNVKREINEYIKLAESHLNKTTLTATAPLPNASEIKFYFLTNKGKYTATEKMKNIENEKSEWLSLFEEANKLIEQIRIASEK